MRFRLLENDVEDVMPINVALSRIFKKRIQVPINQKMEPKIEEKDSEKCSHKFG